MNDAFSRMQEDVNRLPVRIETLVPGDKIVTLQDDYILDVLNVVVDGEFINLTVGGASKLFGKPEITRRYKIGTPFYKSKH
jgi:hypothetical protein